MDIDVIAKHIPTLLAFKDRIEKMIGGSDDHVAEATDELLSFKSEFEAALPDIRKAIADASALADDIAAVKKDLEPALAWIAEQQAKETPEPAEPEAAAAEENGAHEAGWMLPENKPAEIAESDGTAEEKTTAQITLDQINASTKPSSLT